MDGGLNTTGTTGVCMGCEMKIKQVFIRVTVVFNLDFSAYMKMLCPVYMFVADQCELCGLRPSLLTQGFSKKRNRRANLLPENTAKTTDSPPQ